MLTFNPRSHPRAYQFAMEAIKNGKFASQVVDALETGVTDKPKEIAEDIDLSGLGDEL